MSELLEMTRDEVLLATLVTMLCVGGLLLPQGGNMIGQALMGEDPAVLGWRKKLVDVRARRREQRLERQAAKRKRKRERREMAMARKATRQSGTSAKATATPESRT